MNRLKRTILSAAVALLASASLAQEEWGLNVTKRIDDTFVFAFDLSASRSAKGGIWNVKKRKFVTPQNYSEAKTDTINGKPVVLLYRQVALGNHPLNGWETWAKKGRKWVKIEDSPLAPPSREGN